jgi:anhydro-N-acetylmuramic acid kinase
VRHRPDAGYTVQLGNAALLAEVTGISVVSDFRSRDIAAGGQGAPLVPAFHQALFGDQHMHRVIANLGGIANVTNLPPGTATSERPIGFDTGPGNLLLDLWVETHRGTTRDEGGAWAASGTVDGELLDRMLDDAFLSVPPPRSTGRDHFNAQWLSQLGIARRDPADVQATLAEFTAQSLTRAICTWCGNPQEVLLCGGGVHNADLVGRIVRALPASRVTSTSALGIDPDYVEACAFAWLAWRALNTLPGNLPAVTGARGPRVLGAIYPAGNA